MSSQSPENSRIFITYSKPNLSPQKNNDQLLVSSHDLRVHRARSPRSRSFIAIVHQRGDRIKPNKRRRNRLNCAFPARRAPIDHSGRAIGDKRGGEGERGERGEIPSSPPVDRIWVERNRLGRETLAGEWGGGSKKGTRRCTGSGNFWGGGRGSSMVGGRCLGGRCWVDTGWFRRE